LLAIHLLAPLFAQVHQRFVQFTMTTFTSSDYLESAAILNNAGVALLTKKTYDAATDHLNEALVLVKCAIKAGQSNQVVASASAQGRDNKEKLLSRSSKATFITEEKNESCIDGCSTTTSTLRCQTSTTSLAMPPQEQQQQTLHQVQQRQQPIVILQVPNNTDSGSSLCSLRVFQFLASIIILNLSIANQDAAVEDSHQVNAEVADKHLEMALRLAQMSWSVVSQLLSVMTHAQALEKPTLLILAETTLRHLIAVQEQQQQQTAARGESSSSSSSRAADTMKYYQLLHGVIHTFSMIQATRALFNSAHAAAASA
jgi:hypothetical protein